MAQAFTREIDDAPPAPPAERPISPHMNLVTHSGAQAIERALAKARAALDAAAGTGQEPLAARDLRYWQARRASMQVLEPDPAGATIGFGMRATIRRRGQLAGIRIVGEDEADPARGLLAWTAPLAKALEGAEAGETVDFILGGRSEPVEIVSVGDAGTNGPGAA